MGTLLPLFKASLESVTLFHFVPSEEGSTTQRWIAWAWKNPVVTSFVLEPVSLANSQLNYSLRTTETTDWDHIDKHRQWYCRPSAQLGCLTQQDVGQCILLVRVRCWGMERLPLEVVNAECRRSAAGSDADPGSQLKTLDIRWIHHSSEQLAGKNKWVLVH